MEMPFNDYVSLGQLRYKWVMTLGHFWGVFRAVTQRHKELHDPIYIPAGRHPKSWTALRALICPAWLSVTDDCPLSRNTSWDHHEGTQGFPSRQPEEQRRMWSNDMRKDIEQWNLLRVLDDGPLPASGLNTAENLSYFFWKKGFWRDGFEN